MAAYIANVAADTTGKGPVPTTNTQDTTVSDPATLIRLLANQGRADAFYGEIIGTFTYDGAPDFFLNGGTVDAIITYKGSPPGPDATIPGPGKLETYIAANTPIDIMVLLGLTGEESSAYLFRMSDEVAGSPFNDKLKTFAGNDIVTAGDGNDKVWGGAGNDIIFGGTGNDKMWGNGGKDTFGFKSGDGKDHLKDFSKKKDALIFDTDMVRNQNKLEKLADEKGNKVVINFGGGDKVIIHDFSLLDLHKSTISFLDLDL